MITCTKKDFIVNLFKILEEKNVHYCILRNYEDLPDSVGHDIDILIDYTEKTLISDIMNPIISELGWKYTCIQFKNKFITLICYNITESSVDTVKLDIWTNFLWRGIPWIHKSSILQGRRFFNGFYVPSEGSEAAVTVLKEIMGRGKVPKKYYSKIKTNSIIGEESFKNCFSSIYGIDFTNKLHSLCVNEKFESINQLDRSIKNKLIYKSFWSVKEYIWYIIRYLCQKICEFIKPRGKFIVVVGPDGSGKSTIIEKLSNYLGPFFPFVKNYHVRFGIFPELKTGHGISTMKGKLTKSQPEKNKKIKRSIVSKLATWFVVIYYLIEFILGRIVIRRIKQKNGLIIFDRYFFDFFVQPTSRDLIYPLRKLLCLLISKPDITIHLNADPEIVYRRKKELGISEIAAQNNYFKRLLKDIRNSYSVDTSSKSIENIVSEVFTVIIQLL